MTWIRLVVGLSVGVLLIGFGLWTIRYAVRRIWQTFQRLPTRRDRIVAVTALAVVMTVWIGFILSLIAGRFR